MCTHKNISNGDHENNLVSLRDSQENPCLSENLFRHPLLCISAIKDTNQRIQNMSVYGIFTDPDPWAEEQSVSGNKPIDETYKTVPHNADLGASITENLNLFGQPTGSSMIDSLVGGVDSLSFNTGNNWRDYNSSNILHDQQINTHTDRSTGAHHASRESPIVGESLFSKENADNNVEMGNIDDEEDDDSGAEYDDLIGSANLSIWTDAELKKFNPLSNKNSLDGIEIKVKAIPEKEGLVFKHINYLVCHTINFGKEYAILKENLKQQSNETQVVRRYSDFVWLVEVLWKKYPFRLIPELPPKQFGLASTNDKLFLQKRRRGLQRFLYQLCKHPVLSKEKLTIMFLTVPSAFSNWRKFANIELNDEFDGIRVNLPRRFRLDLSDILKGLRDSESEEFDNTQQDDKKLRNRNDFVVNSINQIWKENPQKFKNKDFISNMVALNENLSKLAAVWAKLYILVERIEKREYALAIDHHSFGTLLDTITGIDTKVFGMNNIYIDQNRRTDDESQNLTIMNSIIHQVGKYFTVEKKLKEDEMVVISNVTLESWKMFQDYLISLHFLIERFMNYKNESEREIQDLLNRIMRTTERIKKLKIKSDIRGSEVDRNVDILTQSVDQLSMSISRIIFVKTNFVNEFKIFQKVKYLISEVFQDWFDQRSKYFDMRNDSIQRLLNDLRDMPLGA